MGVSKNSGTPKSSILIGISIIFTIHFEVPLFLETPRSFQKNVLEKKHLPGSGDSRKIADRTLGVSSFTRWAPPG